MSDDCARVEALADELALGMLTGAERGRVLVHLDECRSCRAEVASLTEAADAVLLLAPPAAPDDGFDQRVLDRIAQASGRRGEDDADPPARRRAWRPVMALAAAAAVVVLGLASLAGGHRGPTDVAAPMIDGGGGIVGHVSLMAADGTVVGMDLPGWDALARRYGEPTGGRYRLELALDDGTRTWAPSARTWTAVGGAHADPARRDRQRRHRRQRGPDLVPRPVRLI